MKDFLSFKPDEDKEPYIFISYSSLDRDAVEEDLKKLNKMGFRIWYDQDVEFGNWHNSLEKHIKDCKIFLIFVSNNSIESKFVIKELDFASDIISDGGELIIIPIFFENIKPSLRFSSLKNLECIKRPNEPTIKYYLELQQRIEAASPEVRLSHLDIDSRMLSFGYLPTIEDIYSDNKLTQILCENRRKEDVDKMENMTPPLASYNIDNIFQLTSDKTKALHNLEAFIEFESNFDKPYNLVSLPLDIGKTYISPLRLIRGLITRLDTNWPPLLNSYSRLVKLKKADLLDDLHYFIEFCWLAWGPSVLTTFGLDENEKFIVLQVAYGDEANSLPLIIKRTLLQNCLPEILKNNSGWPVVIKNVILVKPGIDKFFSEINNHPLFTDMFSGDDKVALYLPDGNDGYACGDITLCHQNIAQECSNEPDSFYSTAYVWLMLEQVDKTDFEQSCINTDKFLPGRVLPFFEHANLATKKSLNFLQHCLARKAIFHVLECEADRDYQAEGYYRFATALFPDEMVKILNLEKMKLNQTQQNILDSRLIISGDPDQWRTPLEVVKFSDALNQEIRDSLLNSLEISSSQHDLDLLEQFYNSLYVTEFPDPDERESLENMINYIKLKEDGWYQKNNYHILLFFYDGIPVPVSGAIIDYLADTNVGIIEFFVVSASHRKTGLGKKLLHWIEKTLDKDSQHAGCERSDYIIAEMNDPFKTYEVADSLDPFLRSMIWNRWGFKRICFPYVQPSLSPAQHPVECLLLLCKPGNTINQDKISASTLIKAIHGYVKWAMRIDESSTNPDCQKMFGFLSLKTMIELQSLSTYIADKSCQQLSYSELSNETLENLDMALEVYCQSFSNTQTGLSKELFKNFFIDCHNNPKLFDYHFLAIKSQNCDSPKGIASFFSFPKFGFCGYLAFAPPIKGKGHLTEVIKIIERTMLMDNKKVSGWFAECDPTDDVAPIFKKRGFYELDVRYKQPPLLGMPAYSFEQAPILQLIYKELGENFAPPQLKIKDFLDALILIFSEVYGIDNPKSSEYYTYIKDQIILNEKIYWK